MWKPKQIERLFDSLLREYPIGAFLFWDVSDDTLSKYPFFEFSKDVVQGGDNHRKKARSGLHNAIGVLDGQQRLTAFLVGLKGSYQARAKSKPTPQRLYLDLLHYNTEAGEEDLAYAFSLMTDAEYAISDVPGSHWYPVSNVLTLSNAVDGFNYLKSEGLEAADGAFERLRPRSCEVQFTTPRSSTSILRSGTILARY